MPTHGDFPWERDERRRQEGRASGVAAAPPGARPLSPARAALQPVLLALLLAATAFALALPDQPAQAPPAIAGATPSAPAAPWQAESPAPPQRTDPRPYRLSGVHSRWRGRSVIEVWGRTTAPDGTTIRVSASSGGVNRRLGLAPAASRRFYLRERVPEALRGRSLAIRLRVLR